MGLKRKLQRRADAMRLGRAGALFQIRVPATTGALDGLRDAARDALEQGRDLAEFVGLIGEDEVRLMMRAFLANAAPTLELPEHVPGSLLVVTERAGEPQFQHVEVT